MKKIVLKLHRAEGWFAKIEEYVIALVLLVIVFLTAYFAIGRKIFSKPPQGLDELARYLIPIVVMLGASVAIHKRSHITAGSIDLFTKNRAAIRICTLFIDLLLILVGVILTYASWKRYQSCFTNPVKSLTLLIPMTILEIPVPIGITLWLVQFILQFFKDIAFPNGIPEE